MTTQIEKSKNIYYFPPSVLVEMRYTSENPSIFEFGHHVFAHPAHSSLRKESPSELMLLTLVWDKTASGTARSKTGNGLHS